MFVPVFVSFAYVCVPVDAIISCHDVNVALKFFENDIKGLAEKHATGVRINE